MSGFSDKKEQIKNAAKTIFTKYGYYKTTLEDIANLAGMKKNSLYYYFDSKEALFNEIIVESSSNYICNFKENLNCKTSYEEKLRYYILYSTHKVKNDTALSELTLSTMREFGEVIEKSYTHFIDKAMEVCTFILNGGIESGEFNPHDTQKMANHIIGTISAYEFKFYHKLDPIQLIKEVDREPLIKQLTRFCDFTIMAIKKK